MNQSPSNREKGNRGEDAACSYLMAEGFEIVQRNFHARTGEIDIIAVKTGCIHFIEVKARRDLKYGHPTEAVTGFKRRRMIKAAWYYLLQNPYYRNFVKRMSVLSIHGGETGIEVNFYENAFEVPV